MAINIEKLISNKTEYRKYQDNCLKWATSLNWEDASQKSMEMIEELVKNK